MLWEVLQKLGPKTEITFDPSKIGTGQATPTTSIYVPVIPIIELHILPKKIL
jgi:hypothetical protein